MSEENLDNAQKNQKKVGAASDDPHTTGPAENVREEAAEMVDENERSKDPMSPENIQEHDPTAVQRNEDTNITQEGQAGTNTEEAREKYKKKGMTEV
jgi:hypothetical protein